jgi:protein-S-isoprenylcysteine O-methyltransferase Ste14
VNVRLALKNAVFTFLAPGTVAVIVPWLIVRDSRPIVGIVSWLGAAVIGAGIALYLWCVWNFATVGRGTPAPWDAPRRFVATGPYRWVRNPMYIAVVTVVLGEAWLFASLPLAIYGLLVAAFFHGFVVLYEEPSLTDTFGDEYLAYRAAVSRWIPRPPRDDVALSEPPRPDATSR